MATADDFNPGYAVPYADASTFAAAATDLQLEFESGVTTVEEFSVTLSEELGLTDTATYPSSPITYIDLPEVVTLESEFFYNYYTRDERTANTTDASLIDINSSSEAVEALKRKARAPRNAILKIAGRARETQTTDSGEPTFLESFVTSNAKTLLREQPDKIVFEGAVANTRFSSLILKDNQVDETFYNEITGSVTFTDAYSKSDTNSQFMLELSKTFFSPLSEETQTASTIRRALSNAQPQGVAYSPTDARFELIAESLRDVRFVEFNMTISNSVVSNMVMGALEDRGNIYQDELLSVVDDAKSIQDRYVLTANNFSVDAAEFDLELAPVYTTTVGENPTINESSIPIGYYIEKTEIQMQEDGTMSSKNLDPIVVDTYGPITIFDPNIRYGATYVYRVKIIYMTAYEATATDLDQVVEDERVFAVSMVASEGTLTQVVAVERIPPDPPQNLRFNFDFRDNTLNIFWEGPFNPQRDVVRYQIFRRDSIHESFVLLAELDFDKSTSRVVPLETAPPDKLFSVNSAMTYFKDQDFEKSKEYIYALASVDARGLTSGYSEQIKVFFDIYDNKIKRERVSPPDAPKSYPNLYLKKDLFVDAMASSDASRMRVFFDPEYYELNKTKISMVHGEKGPEVYKVDEPLKLLSDKYKIQIINLDLQNSETFDISILDNTGMVEEVPLTDAVIKTIL